MSSISQYFSVSALAVLLMSSVSAPAQVSPEARVMWCDRWNSDTPAKVTSVVDYCTAHKINMLFIQVYGGGYSLYTSSFVPHWTQGAGTGFDALQDAITKGHAQGLEVHAWCNIDLVHQGSSPTPTQPTHLINLHPEWAMVNSAGVSDITKVGVNGTNIWYGPHFTGFRQYQTNVCAEIATNYAVEGVHLDYIRYPGSDDGDYDYNATIVADFQAQYGHAPVTGDPDFEKMRFDDVTNMVTSISSAVHAARPLAKVTTASWRTPGSNFQSPTAWLENGLIDASCPMIYTGDTVLFQDQASLWKGFNGGRHIYGGILLSGDKIKEEIVICRGMAGFLGQALQEYPSISSRRTKAIDAAYTAVATVPPMPWLSGGADTLFPNLYGVKAGAVQGTGAVIRWHTNELTNARVDYGLTTAYGSNVTDATQLFQHDVNLGGLTANTTYHYKVTSTDAAGHATASADKTFVTTAGPVGPIVIDDMDVDMNTFGEFYITRGSGGLNNQYIWASGSVPNSAWTEARPNIPVAGNYKVYVQHRAGANRNNAAKFTVFYNGGKQTYTVNQTLNDQTWVLLGTHNFASGTAGYVKTDNTNSSGKVTVTDAVKFEP